MIHITSATLKRYKLNVQKFRDFSQIKRRRNESQLSIQEIRGSCWKMIIKTFNFYVFKINYSALWNFVFHN